MLLSKRKCWKIVATFWTNGFIISCCWPSFIFPLFTGWRVLLGNTGWNGMYFLAGAGIEGLGLPLSRIILFPVFQLMVDAGLFHFLKILGHHNQSRIMGTGRNRCCPERFTNKIFQSSFDTGKRFYFGWTVYLGRAIPFEFRWTLNSVADHFRFSHWDFWFKFQFLRISSVCFQASGNSGWIVMCSRLW